MVSVDAKNRSLYGQLFGQFLEICPIFVAPVQKKITSLNMINLKHKPSFQIIKDNKTLAGAADELFLIWSDWITKNQLEIIWTSLIWFNPTGSNLVSFDLIIYNLILFNPIWFSFIWFELIWSNLNQFYLMLSDLNQIINQIKLDLIQIEAIWSDLNQVIPVGYTIFTRGGG